MSSQSDPVEAEDFGGDHPDLSAKQIAEADAILAGPPRVEPDPERCGDIPYFDAEDIAIADAVLDRLGRERDAAGDAAAAGARLLSTLPTTEPGTGLPFG